MRQLTSKEELAVSALLEGKSKTEAYRVAYDTSRQSLSSVQRIAFRIFARPAVAEEVERRQTKARKKSATTVEWALSRFRQLADLDVADVIELDSRGRALLKPGSQISDIPIEVRRCIKSLKNTMLGCQVEFHDPVRALENIAKHLGMFSERHLLELSGAGLNLNIYLDREAPPMSPADIVTDDVQREGQTDGNG